MQGVMSAIEPQNDDEWDACELEKYLVCAAAKGDLDEVERLVKAGADFKGRYFPPPGTLLGRRVKILKVFDNRYRALIEGGYGVRSREKEVDINIIGWTPLQAASAGGHLSTVRFLIESGGDVNEDTRESGMTPLQWAAATQNLELIQLLLDRGANVNARPAPCGGMTALQIAAEKGCQEVVHLLLRSGADANQDAAPILGLTALQAACFHGKLHLVQLLLDRGARINGSISKFNGTMALSAAAQGGYIKIVQLLVERGADVNNRAGEYARYRTALEAAAKNGHWKLAELLLAYGADVNAGTSTCFGSPPLQSAVEQGNSGMAEMLISRGARVDGRAAHTYARTALQSAAENADLQMVHFLLLSGASACEDAGSIGARTALQGAAERGHLATVRLLISRGAIASGASGSRNGQISLQAAAGQGHLEIARCLVDSGVDPKAENTYENEMGALQEAAAKGHEEMVRWLVSLGVDVNATVWGRKSGTALEAAAEHGHIEIVRFLLAEAGAEVNARAEPRYQGTMALQAAAREGHIDIVELLIKAGAGVDGPFDTYDNDAQTPLRAAASRGHVEIAKLLVASGADVNALKANGDAQGALQRAAENGRREMVRWLLEAGADIHAKCSGRKSTVIEGAVSGGDKVIVQMCVSAGASKSIAFSAAAAKGHLHIVKLLHSQGVRADGTVEGEEGDNCTRQTPLQKAAAAGAYPVVRFLLANKADINAPALGDGGRTALQAAAERGHLEIVKHLLSMKAEVNAAAADVKGKSALQAAVEDNCHEIAFLLLSAGATVHDTVGSDGQSLLHRVCDNDTIDLFRALAERCTDQALNLTDSSGSTALHLAIERGHTDIVDFLLNIPQLNKEIYDMQQNTPLGVAIVIDDTATAKLLLNKGARTDGLTPEQVQTVANILKGGSSGPSESDDNHWGFILLSHNRSTGTHVERTSEATFDINEWDLYEWEKNAKTSILLPSSGLNVNDDKDCSTFVFPDYFLPNTQYPSITQTESLVQWAWSTFFKPRGLFRRIEICGFRDGVPHSQEIKSNVLLVPYIRFVWPPIFVDAPHLKPTYTETVQSTRTLNNTIADVTGGAADVSGFTYDKHRIDISWVMAKRNLYKESASEMRAIHFRGNLTRKVTSIPDSAAEFVVWLLVDIYDHWVALLEQAGKQLMKLRDFQLAAEGTDKGVIKSLLMHSREWNKLRETLRKHVEKASDLVKQFKESELLFGELLIPLGQKAKEDRVNNDHNTKALRSVESSMPEPSTLVRRATQTITNNSKHTQHVPFDPPRTPRMDKATKTKSVNDLPKIRELEERLNLIEGLRERLSGLDAETKEMIGLEFNLVSIHEARESVKMSQSMKRLSWITFIFLPLMFVTGLFGMNVDILESNPSWKWYPISAAPLMAFVILAWYLFKCQSWYKPRDLVTLVRNPKRLFVRVRKGPGDEEMGQKVKEQ